MRRRRRDGTLDGVKHIVIAVVASSVAGCSAPANRYTLTEEERARFGHAPEPAPRRTATKPEASATPVATAEPAGLPPAGDRCERTRADRVKVAKDTLTTTFAHWKEIAPLMKWASDHKCELRDNTGTILITKTREAGGTRVAIRKGYADEIVCNTTKIPPELTVDVMREYVLLDSYPEDTIIFETWPECDDKEKPSLRVRFNDKAAQKAILALPD